MTMSDQLSACLPSKGVADQTEGDMDQLDRAGLRQDSQKRLQQESVLAYAGISQFIPQI